MIRILFLFIVEIFFFSSIYASTTWKIENNTLYISGKGDMNVDAGILNNGIPDHSDETPWFLYRYNFNKLIIEEGVTSISKRAFVLCKNIESIVIPSSMKTIGDYAFNHCFVKKENISNNSDLNLEDYGLQIIDTECNDGLLLKNNSVVSCRLWAKSVEIPQGVSNISDNAFYQCRNLESITIPGSITSIGNNVFGYCFMTRKKFINNSQLSFENSGIEFAEKELPNGLLTNGDAIVACRPWAKSLLIPDNIKCIKSNAFYLGFDAPNSIVIPNTVTEIEYGAFYACTNLKSIVIPNSVKNIGYEAFIRCSDLESVILPNSITKLGSGIFQYCNKLDNLIIPSSVSIIERQSFYGCKSLSSITIPNSVTNIEKKAFFGCDNLASVVNLSTVPQVLSPETFEIYGTLHVLPGCKSVYEKTEYWKNFTIVENAEIPHNTIYYTSIDGKIITPFKTNVFGANVISNTYDNGKGVIKFDGDVISIGERAFYNCSRLTSITIPNSVTSIGEYSFRECSGLTSITIPNSVASIGDYAFQLCSGLKSIVVDARNANYDSRDNCNAIIETSTNTLLCGCKNTVIPNSVTSIGVDAFRKCSGLTSIIIPNSVTSIGDNAFCDCSGLTSITIPNSVTRVGNYAFYYCYGLASVTNLSTTPQNISYLTFSKYGTLHVLPGCKEKYLNADYWKKFTIVEDAELLYNKIYYTSSDGNIINPYNVDGFGANIVSNIYENGQGIITFDGDVTSIGDYAFSECRSLVSIKIPNSVTSIGDNAFDGCSSLMNTVIPNSVTNIGSLAFKNCPSIIDVIIPNSVKNIATAPFAFCPNIKSIKVDADNTVYDSRENCNAIINSSKNELIQGCVNTIIPKNVTKIGYGAFAGCEFTEMVIPNEVTDIGADAFYGCKKLANIIIPRNVIFINFLAFYGCPELTNVTSLAATPPTFGSGEAFEYYGTLHVLPGCKTAYENAEYWNRFTIVEDAVDPSASIVLADGTPYNEETTQYNKDITYTRTFNNTKWQALYVPFSMSYEDWKDNFDVSYINGIRQYDKNEDGVIEETVMDVIMIKNGSLIPNTPYLIRAKSVGEKSITINNATLYKAEDNSIDCSTTIARYKFTGTYTPIPASVLIENNYYAMGGGALVISNGSDLKPYRWYMQIDARSPLFDIKDAAKRITINLVNEDDVVSGITEYTNTQQSSSDSQIYDLNGRKVSKSALKSGLYIKNGKKVVIKTNACE